MELAKQHQMNFKHLKNEDTTPLKNIFFAMYDTYLLKVLILAVLNIFTHERRLANCAGIHLTTTYATTLLLLITPRNTEIMS